MKKLIVLALLLTTTACSTIRLNYKADIATPDGKAAVYTLKKSYPIGGAHAPLCFLTGIFFGGYCWFYLAMPTVPQSEQVEIDAKSRLNSTLGGNYAVTKASSDFHSWSDAPEESNLEYASASVSTKVVGAPATTSTPVPAQVVVPAPAATPSATPAK